MNTMPSCVTTSDFWMRFLDCTEFLRAYTGYYAKLFKNRMFKIQEENWKKDVHGTYSDFQQKRKT